jgi:hypothetical protein
MFHLDTHVYDIFLSMGENIDGPIYILWNQHLRNQAQKSIEYLASIAAVQRALYGQARAQTMGPKMGLRIWRPGY